MLKVYLENLEEAGARGRNLLSKKYARMDNLIPVLSDNPANDDGRKFSVYLRFCLCSEPETYGDRTFQPYCKNVRNAEAHLANNGD